MTASTLFTTTLPVWQAPIGSVASVELAAAVSNAGGVGALALSWTEPELAARQVKTLRQATANPFAVNFVLAFPPRALAAALAAGAPVVTFSWGHSRACIEQVHQAGALAGVQVGSVAGARRAVEDGADFLICQGIEAGGHVQSTTPLADWLAAAVAACSPLPIVATGGLAHGADLAWAREFGAAAIMLGTRFVASRESYAHRQYKQAIVEASTGDTAYTLCFNGGWPYAAHRVLRNATLRNWEAAGCPRVGQRPGEGQVIAYQADGSSITRYDDTPPLSKTSGAVLDCCLYAGDGCGAIDDIPGAADIVKRIMAEEAVVFRDKNIAF